MWHAICIIFYSEISQLLNSLTLSTFVLIISTSEFFMVENKFKVLIKPDSDINNSHIFFAYSTIRCHDQTLIKYVMTYDIIKYFIHVGLGLNYSLQYTTKLYSIYLVLNQYN